MIVRLPIISEVHYNEINHWRDFMHLNRTKKMLASLSVACLLSLPVTQVIVPTGNVDAAIFTKTEKELVDQLQTKYENLDKTPYSSANLYEVAPSLVDPFSAGTLPAAYINAQVAYINYYRSLFDLPAIVSNAADNQAAQVTASVMAAAQASPYVDQHGLNSVTQPEFIDQENWLTARQVSSSSNLNFSSYNESSGDVVTDYLKDNYNLTGNDTGHRAWLLSTRLSRTGIGAAYGTNGIRYSVQTVMYGDDIFRAPTKNSVPYPSTGVFPIELLQGGNIPWSYYLSDTKLTTTPQITVRDIDTGITSTATNVGNYSSHQYGNFNTILTYYPGNINLVSGHEYQVVIQGVATYNFKLYNQVRANQPAYETPATKPVVEKSVTDVLRDQLTKQAEKLRDSLDADRLVSPAVFGRSYQDKNRIYNLGAEQWYHDFYHYSNPELQAGILDVREHTMNREVFTSPYANQQTSTHAYLEAGKSYPYGQKIEHDDFTWYYLGTNQWVRQKTIKTVIATKI